MATTKEQANENLKKAHSEEARKKQKESRAANALIRNAVYDQLKHALLADTKKGKAYYSEFIDKYLATALKYPDSKPAQTVAGTIFQQEILTLLDEQHEKEMQRDKDFQRYRLLKDFFLEQRNVVLETNHRRKLLVCCSRRAGKTDLASGSICYAAIIPNSRIIYINLTFTNAINQIWNNVNKRSDECGLTISKSSKADGTIEWSNGSSLRIMGNPNNAEIEKLRGESKVSLVVVDEFFHQRNMQYAVDEVISPLMADRADSTLLCMGTPPRIPKTYGEKCWTSEKGWKKFHWTMEDNPYMPNPEEYLKELCEAKGITMDSPFIQREYKGQMGVYDLESMVFNGRQTYNEFDINQPITDIAIGVDYGWSDSNAVVTVAYNKKEHTSWVVKEDMFNKAGVSETIDCIQKHYDFGMSLLKRNRLNDEHIKIYADTNEESITYDLMSKYKLPAFNCYKYNKIYAIEMLAEELRTGRMKIINNGVLDEEMEQILWKRDDEDNLIPELDEDMGIHPNAMMALLYASRKVFFDMDYDIEFKESQPETNTVFKKTESGVILGIKPIEPEQEFEDSGVIG